MKYIEETVLEVNHYTDSLFSFKTSRSRSFRFEAGQFAMIGLYSEKYNKNIFRAYSIVSTPYDDYLEFISIKVPNGPLTSILQNIKPNDKIMVQPKTTGSLVIDYLYPKENLVLFATGTGIAPFMSIVQDYKTYEKFKNVYLFHTVRTVLELAYKIKLIRLENDLPIKYIDSVTEEPYIRQGRFWNYITNVLGTDLYKKTRQCYGMWIA